MLCYFIYIIWVDVHKLDIVVFTLPEQRTPSQMFFLHFINNIFSEHKLMAASVNATLEDEFDYDTSFHFCN